MPEKYRYKNTSGYCIMVGCSNFAKCQLKLTTRVIAAAKAIGTVPDIITACVYRHHTFNSKTKEK